MMATSKQDIQDKLFSEACERVEAALQARVTSDEVTYFPVDDLPHEVWWRIQQKYRDLGWKVSYEYCPPDYEDLWFS